AAVLAIATNPDRRDILGHPLCLLLGLFVAYVAIVNVANLFLTSAGVGVDRAVLPLRRGDYMEPFVYSAFYVFNYVYFCGVLCLGRGPGETETYERFWRLLLYATAASLMLQAALATLGLGKDYRTYRTILFFNNPNQLGYYALCAATIMMLGHTLSRRLLPLTLIAYVLALYLSALALSKAGLLAVLALPFIYLINGPTRSATRIITIAAGAALVFVVADQVSDSIFTNLEKRFASFGEQGDDTLAGRAYDRIVNYPQYLAFGAGEGLRFRFDRALEIHSLFGTLLFSYGVVGASIIAVFVARLVALAGFGNALYVVPVALYNLTHNGIRSPLMWLLFAMLTLEALRSMRTRAVADVPGPALPLDRPQPS
ncbi:MAG: hypothetical protein JXB36_11105, partial [Gammaproteobacteria bacterium]|nr:hypothetical protein [Gammaproteobacteria bacterium]